MSKVVEESPWNGWAALPGWVICLEPKDKPTFSAGGIQIVAEKNMRPTVLQAFSVGPPVPLEDGSPGLPFAVKDGDMVVVPEYGVHVHEDLKRGNLRCFRHEQVLARLDPDPPAANK